MRKLLSFTSNTRRERKGYVDIWHVYFEDCVQADPFMKTLRLGIRLELAGQRGIFLHGPALPTYSLPRKLTLHTIIGL